MGQALLGLLADQAQHDRDVVRAEAPERVLVRAQLAEVQAVAVDVVELAELAAVDQLLQALDRGVVLEQVADHQDPAGAARPPRRRARRRRRSSPAASRRSSACPPRATRDRELGVGGHGRGEHDRVELGVVEQVLEARPSRARSGSCARARSRACSRGVAQPARARSRGSRRSCARGWGPSSRGPTTPTRDRCARSLIAARRDRSAATAIACTQRSRRVAVAVQRRALRPAASRAAPRARPSASRSTSVFQPASTVSTHSVFARSVTQGTPARYASFWTPPESVSDRARLAQQRAELDVAERLGQRQALESPPARSSRPASLQARARARVQRRTGPAPAAPRSSSTSARRRAGSSTLPARWAVSSR